MSAKYAALHFQGVDARAFLQAQLATDLRALGTLHWCWAAVCTLKGRAIATGPLLHLSAEHWLWVVKADLAETLMSHLRRYLLRSKVRIECSTNLQLRAKANAGDAHTVEQLQRIEVLGTQHWALANLPQGWTLELEVMATADGASDSELAQWARLRLRAGLAMLDLRSSEQHLAQALELPRLNAVSLNKGCYPGQEIIARTHYLGQSKRQMVLLQGSAAVVDSGASIEWQAHAVGQVIESAGTPPDTIALAIVEQRALEQPRWQISGEAVELLDWQLPAVAGASDKHT